MSVVQSVLFNKHINTIKQCLQWLQDHNMKHYKVDETENYYRWRQVNPKKNDAYSIKTIDEKRQIKFVIAYKHEK